MDIRTIILTLAFGNFVFGVVLILLQRHEEHSLRNPFWIAAKFLQCTGWLLLAGRGTIADIFSYTLGNFCLISGFAYECWAIFRISNRPAPVSYQWAGLAYALLGILAATPLSAIGRLRRFDLVVRAGPRALDLGDLPGWFVPFFPARLYGVEHPPAGRGRLSPGNNGPHRQR